MNKNISPRKSENHVHNLPWALIKSSTGSIHTKRCKFTMMLRMKAIKEKHWHVANVVVVLSIQNNFTNIKKCVSRWTLGRYERSHMTYMYHCFGLWSGWLRNICSKTTKRSSVFSHWYIADKSWELRQIYFRITFRDSVVVWNKIKSKLRI